MNLFALKKHLPFYRRRWQRRYRAMVEEINARIDRLEFGRDGDVPWLEDTSSQIRIHGFATEPQNLEVYELLHPLLPARLPATHFRLVKDYLTRYVYPHMRPDLKPSGYAVDELWGFHGQHKDAISDLADTADHERLHRAFVPREDDIIIDGGAFLGIGDLQMSPAVKAGRIVAIEANRACFELLQRNIVANGAHNVTPMHRAVWNSPGTLDLEVGFAQANTLVKEVSRGERTLPVETVTVDAVVEELSLPRVAMLSLTLNGAEVEALEGAHATLSTHRPRVRLAGWYSRGGVPIWQLTKRQLEAHGYEVFVGSRGNVMALPGEARQPGS